MKLRESLRLAPTSRTALVGAGGKTTALFQLARSFDTPVVVTATTHLGVWQANFADRHLQVSRAEDVRSNAGQIEGVTLISGPAGEDQRLQGLEGDLLDAVRDLADQLGFPILVEADGARQKPLKAPAAHEPVIPPWVDSVIVVAGLAGLGHPLDQESVHRPDVYSALSGLAPGSQITLEGLTRVLAHPQGGLKGIPSGAHKVALLNQAGTLALAEEARSAVRMLVPPFDACILAALADQKVWRVTEPTAGILLAAGESSRFGAPKMLLPWRGKPLIRGAAEAALSGGLDEVIVVTGAADEGIRAALEGLPVRIIRNTEWQAGQSSSVRLGLESVPENTGAVLFLLADQPFVNADLIRGLLDQHQTSLSAVVAPRVQGQRSNPVLFDRVTFADLLALKGDTGGRAVLDRYPVAYLDWPDSQLLFDIDTPADYARLRALE